MNKFGREGSFVVYQDEQYIVRHYNESKYLTNSSSSRITSPASYDLISPNLNGEVIRRVSPEDLTFAKCECSGSLKLAS